MPFDPFRKPINMLEPSDLALLVENRVAEGYSVEYKSTFPSTIKVARSIASFANTIGGWFIVGVDAHPASHEATAVPGFHSSEFPDPLAKLRDSVRSHIQPAPAFLAKLLQVSTTRSVLVVHVPEGQNTPFIASDGRIYRRLADSSDPVSEKDRYALDRLVDQGRQAQANFHAFCEDPRQFAEGETGAWLSVFIDPRVQPPFENQPDWLSTLELRDLLAQASARITAKMPHSTSPYLEGSIPFQSALFTNHSVLIRQPSQIGQPFNSLELELFRDGRFRLFAPIPAFGALDEPRIHKITTPAIRSYMHSLRDSSNGHLLRFFDMRELWQLVAILVTFYQDWLARQFAQPHTSSSAWAKLILSSFWRHIPLIDSPSWIDHVQEFLLPVSRVDSITIPDPLTPKAYLELPHEEPYWFSITAKLAVALGLPTELILSAAFPDSAIPGAA